MTSTSSFEKLVAKLVFFDHLGIVDGSLVLGERAIEEADLVEGVLAQQPRVQLGLGSRQRPLTVAILAFGCRQAAGIRIRFERLCHDRQATASDPTGPGEPAQDVQGVGFLGRDRDRRRFS